MVVCVIGFTILTGIVMSLSPQHKGGTAGPTPSTPEWASAPLVEEAAPTTTAPPVEYVRPEDIAEVISDSDITTPPPNSAKIIRPIMPAVEPGDPAKKVNTVVYVLDASGSMMGLPFDLLRAELKRSIDALSPDQGFNVVFFQEGRPVGFSAVPVIATPNNKNLAYSFINRVNVKSNSDPIAALKLAFAQPPRLIYLVTDGAFEDNDAVLIELGRLNLKKTTCMNTIGFFSSDAQASERKVCEDVLNRIAANNGGRFVSVLTTDLAKAP